MGHGEASGRCFSHAHLLQLDGEEHGHDGDHVGGVADEPVGPVEDPPGARLRVGPGVGMSRGEEGW